MNITVNETVNARRLENLDIMEYAAGIEPPDPLFGVQAQARLDMLTKPQGSLGMLESLVTEIAAMKREAVPQIRRKVMFTFAGDHGVVEEGVSAFPQAVTAQMIYNFIAGGAAINVFTRQAGAEIFIADLGVAADLEIDHPCFRSFRVAPGTVNFTKGPAMTPEQAQQAIGAGIAFFEEENARQRIDLAGIGEMGIGNTTPATAILAAVSGENIENIVGRGTGIDDNGVIRKIAAIKKGLEVNRPSRADGLDILHKVGGFEIAGLTGVILAAARNRTPVLIDGFISTSAALIAHLINPHCARYLLAAHLSEERGHKKMLVILKKEPLLRLGLRLGEGTGAALAMMIAQAAVNMVNEMATFENAGISGKANGNHS